MRPLRLLSKRTVRLIGMMLLGTLLSSASVAKSFKELLFSPGVLVTAHQKFDSDCDQCHSEFSKTTQSSLCRACHKAIDQDLRDKKGFHGLNPAIAKQECKFCHSDHQGRDFDTIGLSTESFSHDLTNFPLKEKHRELTCDQCHSAKVDHRLVKFDCVDCHTKQDPHQGNMGQQCNDCHSSKNWTETNFDHAKTKYPLTFAHQKVSCPACHLKQQYKDTPQQCIACHTVHDVHAGKFGQDCGRCHNTKEWRTHKFNHNQDTHFKLVDRHAQLTCQSCHTDPKRKTKLPETCHGCHQQQDPHNGSFGNQCENCHDAAGWRKANFDHDLKTKFPLRGQHQKAPCRSCHTEQTTSSSASYQKLSMSCFDCHRNSDPHEQSLGRECQTCHSETSWQNVVFSHDLTSFPLLGMHRHISCAECHVSTNYAETESLCQHCHKKSDAHQGAFGEQCEHCHNPNDWGMWLFDHARQTSYPLEGAHQDLKCALCHPRPVKLSTQCYACHGESDTHQGAFGQQCQQCHTVNSFSR